MPASRHSNRRNRSWGTGMIRRPRRRATLSLASTLATLVALAFTAAPALAATVHPPLPKLRIDGSTTPAATFSDPCGAAVDSHGDIYVADYGDKGVDVFGPEGAYLTQIVDPANPCALAVDSQGNVYVNNDGVNVVAFTPSAYPPTASTTYAEGATLNTEAPNSVAVDPANDHLYVGATSHISSYKSLAEGSELLSSTIGAGIIASTEGLAVQGSTGDVYVADDSAHDLYILNSAGTAALHTIEGTEAPEGFSGGLGQLAIEQATGDAYVGVSTGAGLVVDQFEPSGAFVSQTAGSPALQNAGPSGIAVDNSAGPTPATSTSPVMANPSTASSPSAPSSLPRPSK